MNSKQLLDVYLLIEKSKKELIQLVENQVQEELYMQKVINTKYDQFVQFDLLKYQHHLVHQYLQP
jgi:hypothetical protein